MTLQEQKNCPMISSKATVASRNSLHWSCKPLIRLRKILASRSLLWGGDRGGVRVHKAPPPRFARRPPHKEEVREQVAWLCTILAANARGERNRMTRLR